MTLILSGSDGVTFPDSTEQETGYANGIGFRNRIINGDMRIAQRGTGAVTTSASFAVDRFRLGFSMDGACSAQQDTSAPAGFVNSLKFTTTTADTDLGTSQAVQIQHRIEGTNVADLGWGAAGAQSITLSFWVRSSLTGTFGGAVQNSASDRSYPFTYTISAADTWEQKSITIPGDTTGTWLTTTGLGIRLCFTMGSGSNFVGTAGSWAGADYITATGATSVIGTLNATWYITGVQLEVGSVATPFERRPYGTELALCYRYFWRAWHTVANSGNASAYPGFVTGVADSTATFSVNVTFPVTMRATPTLTFYRDGTAGSIWDVGTAGAVSSLTLGQNWYDVNGIGSMIFTGTPLTVDDRYGCDLDISAEL